MSKFLSVIYIYIYIYIYEGERESDFINNCYTILTNCHSFENIL